MMLLKPFREVHRRIWQCAVGYWIFAALIIITNSTNAEIATDGTVGPATSLTGPNFEIGANLGATRGTNLFHSFHTFSIDTGESATFTGPGSIENVISRVTGGEGSNIDGLLRSEVGTADFYFINPAGVMFGPNAQVDVPAAFHVSTADELRFQDGTIFSASSPESSALSMASPESFGFLSPQPASLIVNGSQLEFAPASHISMTASSVTAQEGANLVSESGVLHIMAVGESSNAVNITTGTSDVPAGGTIAIRGSSSLNASGSLGTETVALRGGTIEVEDSQIVANNSGTEDGVGYILLEADSVRVINSDISAWTFGEGRGNDIEVVAQQLVVDAATAANGSSGVGTGVGFGVAGSAGDVRIEADSIRLTNGGKLSSIVYLDAAGQGGAVTVIAQSLYIDDGGEPGRSTGIETNTRYLSTGDSGPIHVVVSDDLELVDGGIIASTTSGDGAGGDVLVRAGSLRPTRNVK
jgi:filamentous hemagglutinin family protein